MLGHHNGKTAGKTVEPAYHQKNKGCGASDGCQGIHSDETPCHHGISQVIKLLEYVSQAGGNHELQNQFCRLSGCHIISHIVIFYLSKNSRHHYNTKSWNIPVVFYLLNGILEKSDLDGHLQGIFT